MAKIYWCYLLHRVEKYRPSKLEDLVSHDDIIKTSKNSQPNITGTYYVIKFTINFLYICYSKPIYERESIASSPFLWASRDWKNVNYFGVR